MFLIVYEKTVSFKLELEPSNLGTKHGHRYFVNWSCGVFELLVLHWYWRVAFDFPAYPPILT
jgi:hypothetical protein